MGQHNIEQKFKFCVNGRITEGIEREGFNNFVAPRKGSLPFYHAGFCSRFFSRKPAFLFESLFDFSYSRFRLPYTAGEVIISENPYVSVPNKNKESPQSKCEWCFSSTSLKKCSACHVVWYCSSNCQVKKEYFN